MFLRYIKVHRHKTAATLHIPERVQSDAAHDAVGREEEGTGDHALQRPQVVPISDQLRLVLKDARQRTDTYVVEYRGRPVKTIRGGLRSAVERAGLPLAARSTARRFTRSGTPPPPCWPSSASRRPFGKK